jgi:uroporphyrinogen III methyltransferase/synthase
VLPVELTAAGAQVTEVALYQTLPPQGLTPPARDALDGGEVHLVTFTSSSTAENLAQVLGDDLASFIDAVPGASIGPITSQTARGLGFNLAAEASTYTIDGLVDAVVEYFQAS